MIATAFASVVVPTRPPQPPGEPTPPRNIQALEQQLRHAQKLGTVGRLAAGVAHDFNNLLTAILVLSDLTLAELSAGDPRRENVEQIFGAARSAATLTRQLLLFSRKQQTLEPQILNLNAVVDSMRLLLRRVISEDIELVTALGSPIGRIRADRGQIEQVVMNLVLNARDAMPSGGTLRMETETVDLDQAAVAAHRGLKPGPHVRLTVRDTGIGMGPDVRARLFEPFFTTKDPDKGTGLGLATVHGIVTESGGHIIVTSAPGAGTSLVIYFPCVTAESAMLAPVQKRALVVSGSETILLVEDHEDVRAAIRRSLQRQGYEVLDAADGPAALALLQSGRAPVRLLITDVVLPRMSGRELVDRITTYNSTVRVLYISGHADETTGPHGVLAPGVDFIAKPFAPAQLLTRVREVLDRADRKWES